MTWDQPTTAAREICKCHECGGPVYDLLVHHCGTARVWQETRITLGPSPFVMWPDTSGTEAGEA